MEKEFFERKIRELSDEKLVDLLQLRNSANREIILLAAEEAKRRNLNIDEKNKGYQTLTQEEAGDKSKLRKWNWGAFFLTPVWALANKMELWTILWFIPLVNVFVIFYLGFKGNGLAYRKSNVNSVEDFMTIQEQWSIWSLRIFCISIAVGILRIMTS